MTVEEKARVGANKSQIYRNEKETESSQLEIVFFLKITRRKYKCLRLEEKTNSKWKANTREIQDY